MDRSLKLGVRELVEFCHRRGDLGYGDGPAVRALEGLRTHQEIQRRYQDRAAAEYALSHVAEIDGFRVELGGRIDLVFADETPPRIEEIKTVHAHAPADEDQDAVHWAQLRCYAACYAVEKDLDEVMLSLNRVSLFRHEERREQRAAARAELAAFLDQALREYLRWHRLALAQNERTREQARALEFPFAAFRPQQRHFAAAVYRAVRAKQRLMVEAPTGSGKTISTLFPALKAIGDDLCDQVVYLSAKVSGQQQAVDAIERMPADVSYVVLQAKARSCPCSRDEREVDADGRCLRCIGFFDRLGAAREQLFAARRLDVARIQAVATEHRLCPFELGLQMLPWSDIVICDFNYVFDPLVQLAYFRSDTRRKLLLIDELHNLVDRARGMYSASLSRKQIGQAMSAPNSPALAQALRAMRQALDRVLRGLDADESIADEVPAALLRASQRFSEKLGDDFFGNKHVAAETLEFSKSIFRFQCIAQLFARHHRALGYRPLKSRELKLLCLNAFEYLHDCYPLFQSVCGFSATLSPPAFFQRALGLGEDCLSLRLDPAFPPAHLGVCIADYIDTRYRERDNHIDSICASIAICYRARPGNYLVFFSSYYFMQQVHERFVATCPEIGTLLQQRDFDEATQRGFLASFFEASGQLGFAIMGGRFAEGIDYRGDALIGAIVVGVGLPQANTEQQLIQRDFNLLELDGFDYAFRFPGLIRVQQSAGRVIRSETDRGVVILLDRRFRQSGYARHLPAYWQAGYCNSLESLEQSLQAFWEDTEDTDGGNRDSAM